MGVAGCACSAWLLCAPCTSRSRSTRPHCPPAPALMCHRDLMPALKQIEIDLQPSLSLKTLTMPEPWTSPTLEIDLFRRHTLTTMTRSMLLKHIPSLRMHITPKREFGHYTMPLISNPTLLWAPQHACRHFFDGVSQHMLHSTGRRWGGGERTERRPRLR